MNVNSNSTAERCTFSLECVRGLQRSHITMVIEGDWDIELLEAIVELVRSQRDRLTLEAPIHEVV